MAENIKFRVSIEDDTAAGAKSVRNSLRKELGDASGGQSKYASIPGAPASSGQIEKAHQEQKKEQRAERRESKQSEQKSRSSSEKKKDVIKSYQSGDQAGREGVSAADQALLQGDLSGAHSQVMKGVSATRDWIRKRKERKEQAQATVGALGGGGGGGGGVSRGFTGGRSMMRVQSATIRVQNARLTGTGMRRMAGGGAVGGGFGGGGGGGRRGAGGGGAVANKSLGSGMSRAAAAIPFVGAIMGAAMAGANFLAGTRRAYLGANAQTAGAVGEIKKGYNGLGMGIAETGAAQLAARQGQSASFSGNIDTYSAARFGISQGIGGAGGARIAGQVANLGNLSNSGQVNRDLGRILYAGNKGKVGRLQRAQFAQGALGATEGFLNQGQAAEAPAVAALMGGVLGQRQSVRTIGQAQALTQKTGQDLGGGFRQGGILNRLMMLEGMRKNPNMSMFEAMKLSEEGITKKTSGLLQGSSLLKGDSGKMLLAAGGFKAREADALIESDFGAGATGGGASTLEDLGKNKGGKILKDYAASQYRSENMGGSLEVAKTALKLQHKIADGMGSLLGKVDSIISKLF